MEIISKLIEELPTIFNYLMPGFICIYIFRYVAWDFNERELKHVFLGSVVISFVIKTIFDVFAISLSIDNLHFYTVLLFICSVVSSYASAILVRSKIFAFLCEKMKIYRTPNKQIWNDILKISSIVRVHLKDGITTYMGQITLLEENCREPIIVIRRYQLLNTDGEVIINNNDDDKEFMILNLKDFERIELIKK